MQQEYFERYLVEIRKKKASTARHYQESMRKISQVLHQLGYLEFEETLYDIDSYYDLKRIEDILKSNQEFIDLDERGNRMYTAGLHRYMEFVEGQKFDAVPNPLSLIDCPIPIHYNKKVYAKEVPSRDRVIVRQVLLSEKFLCESNISHSTFTSRKYRTPYMEGHHLIPMNLQAHFDVSLDVYANIISLCPTCHRLLHNGIRQEQKPVLKRLFDERQDRLVESGIRLGKNEFLEIVAESVKVI